MLNVAVAFKVWDALSNSSITFGEPEHTETVSYIVENDLLLEAVSEEAKTCNNLSIMDGVKVNNYQLPIAHEDVVGITLENGECFTCDLLVRFIVYLLWWHGFFLFKAQTLNKSFSQTTTVNCTDNDINCHTTPA